MSHKVCEPNKAKQLSVSVPFLRIKNFTYLHYNIAQNHEVHVYYQKDPHYCHIVVIIRHSSSRCTKSTIFSFFSLVAKDFLSNNPLTAEASGADVSPDADGMHLVVCSDTGTLMFLNLEDYNTGHCVVDLKSNIAIGGNDDFEGVTIDRTSWTPGNKFIYLLYVKEAINLFLTRRSFIGSNMTTTLLLVAAV